MPIQIDYGRLEENRPHLFADALEIMCAFDTGGPVSEADATSLLVQSFRTANETLNADEEDLDDNGYDDDLGSAEITERQQELVDDAFSQLSFRFETFGDSYPFVLKPEGLRLRDDPLTNLQKVYLFLLAASRIRSFKGVRGLKQKLAGAFEWLSKDVLECLLPPSADVVIFGANSEERKARFGTNLKEALPKLAKFMGMELGPRWDPDERAAQGDASIDLVGVEKLDDLENGWHVIIGQCAAYEDENGWQKKRSEADLGYIRSVFAYSVLPQSVLFVPGCYRKNEGTWPKAWLADNVILMDRVRMLRKLEETGVGVRHSIELLAKHFANTPAELRVT